MIQFETNGLERAEVFRTATDHYSLKIVQAVSAIALLNTFAKKNLKIFNQAAFMIILSYRH